MNITSISAVYPNYRHTPPSWRTHLWQIVVRVETDTGQVGWGYGGGGKAAVEIVNGHFAEILVGRSVNSISDIAETWDFLYAESIPYGRGGVAIMALSGVDLALYDALGKAESMPVAALLGEVNKDRMRCYATGPDTNWYAELGFTAQKMSHRWTGDASLDQAVRVAESARTALGHGAEVMFDVYMSWDSEITLRMSNALAHVGIHWFEDVLTPDDLQELGTLRARICPINMAGGEHEFTTLGFAEIARTGAYDIWQPDITWCGGITAGLRIVDMAGDAQAKTVPHRGGEPWGLHLIAGTECEDFAELVMGTRNAEIDDLWLGAPEPENGYIELGDVPGFGVTPNEDLL
jgi:L-alanine-DL-glutamate epimerase-like enolase superfamily enzyme